ncbi:MAG: hypothetical protein GX800_06670 [Clostridiaceae bacterium]|jgi:uncharacterized protein YrrD|nr:hypothetical protein [Clostridiaceae bacterium]
MYNYYKISKQINMTVVGEKSNAELGTINDVLLRKNDLKIIGYVVLVGKVIRWARFLHADSVKKMANNIIYVDDASVLLPLSNIKKNSTITSFLKEIKGAQIALDGREIGNISDALCNTEIGEIAYFEVSDGFLEDILHGRQQININNDIVFGNNNVEIKNKGDQI